jgi:hypothetical protein
MEAPAATAVMAATVVPAAVVQVLVWRAWTRRLIQRPK